MTFFLVFIIASWAICISLTFVISWTSGKPSGFRRAIVKQSCAPSLFAWASATLFVTIAPLAGEWPSAPDLGYVPLLLLYSMFCVAIVVFPTFLLAAALVKRLVPPASPLWKPPVAALIGAIAGPCTMYLWSAGLLRNMVTPDFREGVVMTLTGASALAGAVFAFLFARRKQT